MLQGARSHHTRKRSSTIANENVKRKDDFTQVCVWEGVRLAFHGDRRVRQFEQFIAQKCKGARVQYLEEIKTSPDIRAGCAVKGTGGRNDVFFAVHKEDIATFALKRLQFDIRWIEDVLDNEARRKECSIYPERVKEYRTW